VSAARVAVVTGAGRGLGREICRQLREQGCEVVLTARDVAQGENTARELGVRFHRLDVLEAQQATDLAEWLDQTYGRLDILMNNAGVLLDRKAKLSTMKLEVLEQSLATNTLAPIQLTRFLLPLLLKSRHPRVVNISSRLAQVGAMGPGTPAYRISKLALNAATAILAAELADTPVKVNAASPGWVATHMGGDDAPSTVAQGARTPVWLAMLPDDGPTGRFFEDMQKLEW